MSREVRGRSLPISAGAAGNSKLVLSLWIRGCVTIFDVVALLDGGTIGCGICFDGDSAKFGGSVVSADRSAILDSRRLRTYSDVGRPGPGLTASCAPGRR